MPEYMLNWFRGTWHVSVYDGGKRVTRRSLLTADRKQAEVNFARFVAEMERPDDVTVDYLWDEYRKDREAKVIAENMQWSAKAIKPFFGHIRPVDITTDLCRQYVRHRTKSGRQLGTIWTELNHLQVVLNWAHRTKIIADKVNVERPPKPAPRDIRITREEARRMIQAAKSDHIKLAIAIMAGTAARIGAILELTWDRVNFRTNLITFGDPSDMTPRKGRATVPMTPYLRKHMERARARAHTDYVIEYALRPVASIKRGFSRAAEDANLPHVTPHVLRHSAATWMAEAGRPMSEIAAVLGHTDSRTTERIYAKFTPGYLAKSVAALDLSGVPTGSREPGNENEW